MLLLIAAAFSGFLLVTGPFVKHGITEFWCGIPNILFNSNEEFYCSNKGYIYKYKVLQCIVAQVSDG